MPQFEDSGSFDSFVFGSEGASTSGVAAAAAFASAATGTSLVGAGAAGTSPVAAGAAGAVAASAPAITPRSVALPVFFDSIRKGLQAGHVEPAESLRPEIERETKSNLVSVRTASVSRAGTAAGASSFTVSLVHQCFQM